MFFNSNVSLKILAYAEYMWKWVTVTPLLICTCHIWLLVLNIIMNNYDSECENHTRKTSQFWYVSCVTKTTSLLFVYWLWKCLLQYSQRLPHNNYSCYLVINLLLEGIKLEILFSQNQVPSLYPYVFACSIYMAYKHTCNFLDPLPWFKLNFYFLL